MAGWLEEALDYSQRWINLIHQPKVTEEEGKRIIEESKKNFADHFNKGWLDYRKSITEAGDWAATEWAGCGATFRDVLGREYIDCLGGYGLLDLGWSHPEVIDSVRAQLDRTAMPSQELIDPLRGVLARLMALITPGDIQYSFFCGSGTEAIEGAINLDDNRRMPQSPVDLGERAGLVHHRALLGAGGVRISRGDRAGGMCQCRA
jgi:putrescine aminotransferase